MKYLIGFLLISLAACAPSAKFSYVHEEDHAPAEVQFQNESERAETYVWNFGDGNTSDEMNPVHHYVLSGNYEVSLEAIAKGKSDVSTEKIYVEAPENCLVLIETSLGNMTVQLYDYTPQHRDNFIKLVEDGFYDGLLFHRVIDGFMIQGGDPNSKDAKPGTALGSGGPGYQIPAEITDQYVHIKGALAAARTGGPSNPEKKSAGSQFYIVQGSPISENAIESYEQSLGIQYTEEQKQKYMNVGGTPQLDMNYTVFGEVIEGLDVIDKIAKVAKDRKDRPTNDISMKMTIIR